MQTSHRDLVVHVYTLVEQQSVQDSGLQADLIRDGLLLESFSDHDLLFQTPKSASAPMFLLKVPHCARYRPFVKFPTISFHTLC